MNCKSNLSSIGLFILSLVLGIAAGFLNFFGIVTLFPGAVLFFGFIALALLIILFVLAALAALNSGDKYPRKTEKFLCKCAAGFLKPAVISSVLVIVASVLFVFIPPYLPILNAIVFGIIATFLFFALFLVAEIIACLIEEACCKKPCGTDDD